MPRDDYAAENKIKYGQGGTAAYKPFKFIRIKLDIPYTGAYNIKRCTKCIQ